MRVPLTGASDHFVSEAIYLRDPDHHGIEIYWDRPRELWAGQVARMGTWPLDLEDLLGELQSRDEPFAGLTAGTTMGHVHLRVAEIDSTVRFYRDVLGFGLMAQLGPQAAFLSAGGYHHHLGANVWESRGAPPAPDGSATLRSFTVLAPSSGAHEALLARIEAAGLPVEDGSVRDPSGNQLRLELDPAR
jgi:catechol 2,3-dioxygenase